MKNDQLKSNEIMEYIRDRRMNPIGIILARNDNGLIRMGWSQANRKEGDEFDLAQGFAWARARMIEPVPVPLHIRSAYLKMAERAKKYFQQAVPIWEVKVVGLAPMPKPNMGDMLNAMHPIKSSELAAWVKEMSKSLQKQGKKTVKKAAKKPSKATDGVPAEKIDKRKVSA